MTICILDDQIMDAIMDAEHAAMRAQGWPKRPVSLECGATISEIALGIGVPRKSVWDAIKRDGGLQQRHLVSAVGSRASGGRPEIIWGMVRTRRVA